MRVDCLPSTHPDPRVERTRGYVTAAALALGEAGLTIDRSWMDPLGPRDATIVLADFAMVWDEVSGWRRGRFVSGRQGERTVLSAASYVGGGVLIGGRELTTRVLDGASEQGVAYRSSEDMHDGFEDALAQDGLGRKLG